LLISKRLILLLIILLSLSSFLTAAGNQEAASNSFSVWDFKYKDARTNHVYSKIDRQFTNKYESVSFEHIGFDDEEYVPALRAALLAGTAPDIIWLHQGTEFIEFQSYLEPLNEFLSESEIDFRQDSLLSCETDDGILKALPVSFQGMGWYYNKELFRKAGLDPEIPPTNWNNFLEACEQLKQAGITPIATGNNRPLTTDFIKRSLITAFYSDEEIKDFFQQGRGIASTEFRIIMDFCLQLRENEYLNPDGIYRAYFNFAPDSFSKGECAMIIGLLSDIAHWKEFSDELGPDNVGYFPNLIHPEMKRPGAQLLQDAGIIIGINKNSRNKELAYAYLQNMYSEQSQKLLVEDLGMLMPMTELKLPSKEYPVLLNIEAALNNSGYDIEQFTPSTYIRDLSYRYDKLLINSLEITLDDYIQRLYDKLKLF